MQNKENMEIFVTVATPFIRGAIGVVQLVGDNVGVILQKYFSGPLPDQPGKIVRGNFVDRDNRVIDDVLIANLSNSMGSFQIFEISAHGGMRVLQRIVETLELAGARYVNSVEIVDKIYGIENPIAKEAYKILPYVKSPIGCKFLLFHSCDGLACAYERRDIEKLRSAIESKYVGLIKYLFFGAKVVVIGPPNAGKSTLINTLAKFEHSIVEDLPGTTRDYISADVVMRGVPVSLVDTGGLGKSGDVLSSEVEKKTIEQMNSADLLVVVLDLANPSANKEFLERLDELISQKLIVYVANKMDIEEFKETNRVNLPEGVDIVKISAKDCINISALENKIVETLGLADFDYHEYVAFTPTVSELITSVLDETYL